MTIFMRNAPFVSLYDPVLTLYSPRYLPNAAATTAQRYRSTQGITTPATAEYTLPDNHAFSTYALQHLHTQRLQP
jgi:hypothetical protein